MHGFDMYLQIETQNKLIWVVLLLLQKTVVSQLYTWN